MKLVFELDQKLIRLISRHVSALTIPLIKETKTKPNNTVISDELGGSIKLQNYISPCDDIK
jgi:hypothetical protein